MACANGHIETVSLFLEKSQSHDIQINAKDQRGAHAIHFAFFYGHSDIVELLENDSNQRP